jgi:amidase
MITRVLRVIAGPDGEDWGGLSTAPPPHQRFRRVAMTTGRECGPIGDESLGGLAYAREAAVRAGYEIVDAEGILGDAFEIYNTLRADLDVFDDLREVVGSDIDLLCAGTRKVLDGPPGRGWASAAVRRTWAQSRAVIARIGSIFSIVDALLVPVAAVSAVAHDGGVEVDGRFIEGPDLMAQCRAISLTGFPSLSVPITEVNGRRTVSIQIVGPPGGDLRCCEVAADLKGDAAR